MAGWNVPPQYVLQMCGRTFQHFLGTWAKLFWQTLWTPRRPWRPKWAADVSPPSKVLNLSASLFRYTPLLSLVCLSQNIYILLLFPLPTHHAPRGRCILNGPFCGFQPFSRGVHFRSARNCNRALECNGVQKFTLIFARMQTYGQPNFHTLP